MIYAREATYLNAKAACYACEQNRDGVDFGISIEGEGILFICSGCLRDASRAINPGRALKAREDKAEAKARAAAEAV